MDFYISKGLGSWMNEFKRPGRQCDRTMTLAKCCLSLCPSDVLWWSEGLFGCLEWSGVIKGQLSTIKGVWLELRLHRASFEPETSWRKDGRRSLLLSHSYRVGLVKMEARVLTVLCSLLLCFSGVVFSTQGFHAGLQAGLALRNLSMNHGSGYPLYMMQLYRSFRTADSSSSGAVNTFTTRGDTPSVDSSDSVLSLMARGE